jgi:hypothetical protein
MGIVFRRRVFFGDRSPSQRPPYPYEDSDDTKLRGTTLLQRHVGGPLSSVASHDSGMQGNVGADSVADQLAHIHATPEELRAIDDMSQNSKQETVPHRGWQQGGRRDRPGLALLQQRGRNLRIRTMR